MAEHDLTEETAGKIMKQYEDDAKVVGDMLANERRRQAEVMRARLAEQRFRRKKNLAKTHEDEVEEAEVLGKQDEEVKVLHDKQENDYKKTVEELQREEEHHLAERENEDAEEESVLAGLSTVDECNQYEQRLREQMAEVSLLLSFFFFSYL